MATQKQRTLCSLVVAIGPGLLYALLADHVLPARWGTAEPTTFAAVLLALVFCSVLGVVLFSQSYARILRSVNEALRRVVAGDYGARALVGPGGVGEFAAGLNELADKLQKGRSAAEATTAGLREHRDHLDAELRAHRLYVAGLAGELRQQLDAAQSPADLRALGETLDALRDLTLGQAGRLQVEAEPFELHAVIRDTVQPYLERARERGLRLQCKVASSVPREAVGDPKRFGQVLELLLDNALEHTAAGEVAVCVTTDASSVGRATVRVAVSDTGPGIGEDHREVLFEDPHWPAVRACAPHQRSGISLALCRVLANRMQGTVGVDSTPGKGAVVWFTAAVEKGFAAEAEAGPAPRKRVVSDRPILLVMQDPDLCGQILTESAAVGLACHIEDRGVQLHDAVQHAPYAMVFVDHEKPGAVTTITAWLPEGSAQVPVVGVPRTAGGGLDRDGFHLLLQDWLGAEETRVRAARAAGDGADLV